MVRSTACLCAHGFAVFHPTDPMDDMHLRRLLLARGDGCGWCTVLWHGVAARLQPYMGTMVCAMDGCHFGGVQYPMHGTLGTSCIERLLSPRGSGGHFEAPHRRGPTSGHPGFGHMVNPRVRPVRALTDGVACARKEKVSVCVFRPSCLLVCLSVCLLVDLIVAFRMFLDLIFWGF